MSNHYSTLGIDRGASEKDVKAAFRRLARRYHPDLNPGDERAEDQFKRINEAYEVLADPDSRRKYDRYGDDWRHADRIEASGFGRNAAGFRGGWGPFSSQEFDLSDLFGARGQHRGSTLQRLETTVDISLEEAFAGTSRRISIAGDSSPRTIEVTIPPGVKTGTPVVVNPAHGLEVRINVKVAPHPRYRRRGNNLTVDEEVPFEMAALGGETQIATLSGPVVLKIPPGSGTGRKIRLSGLGMPELGKAGQRGDLMVVVRPTVPGDLTEEQRDLLEAYRRSRAGGPGTDRSR